MRVLNAGGRAGLTTYIMSDRPRAFQARQLPSSVQSDPTGRAATAAGRRPGLIAGITRVRRNGDRELMYAALMTSSAKWRNADSESLRVAPL